MGTDTDFYQALFRIRRFEESVMDNFPKGLFFGTTHTYLGQEADAVGVLCHRHQGDVVFSNHRCHGHYLAYGGDLRRLFAELMGRATGVSGGRGGSQHLHWRNFYSNGVQGGIVPIATGMALAEKFKASQVVTVVFMGDGTLGEGAIYEAFNLAALWQAPVLFVVENNQIAQTTPVEQAFAGFRPGAIASRFQSFSIPAVELDSSDVLEIAIAARPLWEMIRQGGGPQALILHTRRFGPHSKGDDTRSQALIDQIRQERDPLRIQATRLNPEQRTRIEAQVNAEIQAAFSQALDDPWPVL